MVLLTDSCVSHKRLLILNHSVHRQLFTILGGNNRYSRLFGTGHCRHLLDNGDVGVLSLLAGESTVFHRFDEIPGLEFG